MYPNGIKPNDKPLVANPTMMRLWLIHNNQLTPVKRPLLDRIRRLFK